MRSPRDPGKPQGHPTWLHLISLSLRVFRTIGPARNCPLLFHSSCPLRSPRVPGKPHGHPTWLHLISLSLRDFRTIGPARNYPLLSPPELPLEVTQGPWEAPEPPANLRSPPQGLSFLAYIFVRDLLEEQSGMVEDGVAKVVVEFLKVRGEREVSKATEAAPKAFAAAVTKKGTQLSFRAPDVDFVPLTVSWICLFFLESVFVYLYVCVCVCVYMCIYVYICVYMCMCMCMCVCTCTCIYVCVYVCMCESLH